MLLLRDRKNTKQQGDVGLAIAISWFAQNGFRVAIPLTDSQDYDLVIEIDGKFAGVQVRTTYHKHQSGSYIVNLRVSGGNRSGTGKIKHFDANRFDYLFVVAEDGDKYFIPSNAITNRSAISLCDKYAQYKVE